MHYLRFITYLRPVIRQCRLLCWLLLGSCGSQALAAEPESSRISRWFDDFEGTVYLGVGKGFHQTLVPGLEDQLHNGLLFVLTGELKWRNFFIETPLHRSGANFYSAAFGYRFYQQDNHSWDLIASNYNIWLPENKVSTATPQLSGLHIRDADSVNSLRYQYQWRQHLFGVESGVDVLSHQGIINRLSYSYLWPWRNLDIYLNAALTFESNKVVNYYYGVSEAESRPDRPVYRSGAGLKTHLGLSVLYPLAENWQLDGSMGLNLFSSQYLDSPIVTKKQEYMAILMVRYVF
jgi:outer membrane scaffolding protein for murein synthesis (MipA/OmpV family)